MKIDRYIFLAVLAAVASISVSAHAQEIKQGDLIISQPWVRAAPKGSELTSSYLTIENKGASTDRLVKASTDIAEKVQIQKTSKMGGATTAEPLDAGLPIGAGEKIALAPGSYKLALLKLKTKLKKGEKITISLEFEKAGAIAVPFEVLGAASMGPPPLNKNSGADSSKAKS